MGHEHGWEGELEERVAPKLQGPYQYFESSQNGSQNPTSEQETAITKYPTLQRK
jgi:hypothetical protein